MSAESIEMAMKLVKNDAEFKVPGEEEALISQMTTAITTYSHDRVCFRPRFRLATILTTEMIQIFDSIHLVLMNS